MQELFTYSSLSTLTGSATATILLVQFLKQIKPLNRLSNHWLVIIVGECIVFVANWAGGAFQAVNIPLYFINGLVVAASAMSGWEIIQNKLSDHSKKLRLIHTLKIKNKG